MADQGPLWVPRGVESRVWQVFLQSVELGSAFTGGRYTKQQAVGYLTDVGASFEDPDDDPGGAEPAGGPGPAGEAAAGDGGGGGGAAAASDERDAPTPQASTATSGQRRQRTAAGAAAAARTPRSHGMLTRRLAAQEAQQSGAETSQAAERTTSVASSPAPGAAVASRQQGRTGSRLQPQPQASEQQGQKDAAAARQPVHQAEDKQGEQQGGRAVSPEPEAEAEGEAAGTSTAGEQQAAGAGGAAAAAGTSTAGEQQAADGGGAAAAGTSTAGEQHAADGGWQDEGPDAAYDPVDAVLAKLGVGPLRPKEFIFEVVRGIQEGTLGADYAEDVAAAIPQVLEEPAVCQQQVARHARVLMRLGAPLVALVVHVCLQDLVDKAEASGAADEAAEAAAAVLERAAEALQPSDPAADHLLAIYVKFTRVLLRHGTSELIDHAIAGLATTLEKCGSPGDADEAHAAAGRLALLADILLSLGQPQQLPSRHTAPLLFVACAIAGTVVQQLGAECPTAVLDLMDKLLCNAAKWTSTEDRLGSQRVARSAAQFCFGVGDTEPASAEVARLVCSAARIVQAAVDAGLMKLDERLSMLGTWVVADVLRVAAQHAEYVRQSEQQPAAGLEQAAAQQAPPQQQAPAGLGQPAAKQGLLQGEAAAGPGPAAQQGPPPLQAPAGAAQAVAQQGPAAQQAPEQAAVVAGEQLQQNDGAAPAPTFRQLLTRFGNAQGPPMLETVHTLDAPRLGLDGSRKLLTVDTGAERRCSVVIRMREKTPGSEGLLHKAGLVDPAVHKLSQKGLDTAMQSAELSVRDVKEALVRERNAQLAAEIAVRLHVLQQTGQRLELDRVGDNVLYIRFPGSRASAPGFAAPLSLAHQGARLSVMARYGVLYEERDGALLLKAALVECVQRAACGEDEGQPSDFAARHEASDAAAKKMAAAGVASLTVEDKTALLAEPVHRHMAKEFVAAWSADSPLGAAAIELADHIPELTKLLVGATAKLELEDGVAAVRAALAALTSVEFEAGVGADPTADDFDWVTVSGGMVQRIVDRLDADVAAERMDADAAAEQA